MAEEMADSVRLAASRSRAVELANTPGEFQGEARELRSLLLHWQRILHDAGESIDLETHFHVDSDIAGRPTLCMRPMYVGHASELVDSAERHYRKAI
jgi:hypothetical protein